MTMDFKVEFDGKEELNEAIDTALEQLANLRKTLSEINQRLENISVKVSQVPEDRR